MLEVYCSKQILLVALPNCSVSVIVTNVSYKISLNQILCNDCVIRLSSLEAVLSVRYCGLCLYLFVRDEDARSHLRGLQQVDGRLMRGEAYYIIYQDSLEFDLLHVLGMASDGQRLVTYRLGYNTKPNSQPGFVFCLNTENGPQTYEDPQELKFYLNTTLGLGTHIYPKGGHSCVCVHACVCVCVHVCVCGEEVLS